LYEPVLTTVPVAVGALVFNIIEVPVTLVLLSAAGTAPAPTAPHAAATHAAVPAPADRPGLGQHLLSTAKQPVVWAPVLALVLVLAGVGFPATIVNAMKLPGSATTGVALFASGIVLFAQRVAVSRFVIGTVAARNIIVPALVWVILAPIGLSHTNLRLAVLTNALPAPVAAVIFAVQHKQGQREMASAVRFSSVLSIATLGAFIALA
jgi:malonate transporter and related proteins